MRKSCDKVVECRANQATERSREIFFFSLFHIIIHLLPYLFLSVQILFGRVLRNHWTDEFSVTTGQVVLKFGDMVDMDAKLCNRVSKCWTLKLAHGCAQNHCNFVH